MPAQDPLALSANALERGARAVVADIRMEAHPDGVPGLERVGEHHELRLGVRAGANGGAGEPRIADLTDVGRRSAVPGMVGRPGPLLDIKEARRSDDHAIAGANDREWDHLPLRAPGERGLDVRRRRVRALWDGAPLVERRISSGRDDQAVDMAPLEWLEANVPALQDRRVQCHILYDMTWDMTQRSMLKHLLGAIAYRAQKALRDAPDAYADFHAGMNVRTPHELVRHITGVLGYARTLFVGGVWRPRMLDTFGEEVARLHEVMEDLGHLIETGDPPTIRPEQLLQGPLSDAMTHVGQLAMLRRLAGAPVAPENFVFAKVDANNLGQHQPPPASPDPGWDPEKPTDR